LINTQRDDITEVNKTLKETLIFTDVKQINPQKTRNQQK
jgi:hypothetical protein